MKHGIISGIILLCALFIQAGTTITSSKIGYSLSLPDNWVCDSTTPLQHYFYDSSDQHLSMIAISRTDFNNSTVFTNDSDWVRANFIGYIISVESDPLYSVLSFSDSINVRQNGKLWAADAYTYYYETDTAYGDWAEYIRFTAKGTRGYELNVLGPTNDLDSNISTYAAIIENIVILDSADAISVKQRKPTVFIRTNTAPPLYRVNALGMKLPASHNMASQLTLSKKRATIRFSR